ncbi:hypothetical protein GCM10018793_57380 [Streptomyces sulfonofaciens]|uniref:Uncharacterized protein n=1 Tax=Streptomyces sulfonofaciens TaxID=68272 RepID=A0A919L858_9ACTN|nr:hypothetical protein GCM10018793_57380 [Streptomyces sulfonofaciens]
MVRVGQRAGGAWAASKNAVKECWPCHRFGQVGDIRHTTRRVRILGTTPHPTPLGSDPDQHGQRKPMTRTPPERRGPAATTRPQTGRKREYVSKKLNMPASAPERGQPVKGTPGAHPYSPAPARERAKNSEGRSKNGPSPATFDCSKSRDDRI